MKINMGSFKKTEKTISVKGTSKRKAYKRVIHFEGKKEDKKIPTKEEFYSQEYWHDPEFLGFILAIVSGKVGLND